MNQLLSPFPAALQEASLGRLEVRPHPITPLEQLIHDLRQPLGVIESLAYCLELTSSDEQVCSHLRKIQAMVFEADSILERTRDGNTIELGEPPAARQG